MPYSPGLNNRQINLSVNLPVKALIQQNLSLIILQKQRNVFSEILHRFDTFSVLQCLARKSTVCNVPVGKADNKHLFVKEEMVY